VHVHGNHGMEISTPDGAVEIDSAARAAELAMRTAAATLERLTRNIPGTLVEDKRYSLSVHYRLSPDNAVSRLRDTVRDVADRLGLLVTEGNCVLELRPQHASNKGNAVLRLAGELGAGRAEASLLFAGDDVTDEDAFRALRTKFPRAVTINVGDRVTTTAARYRIDNPKQLHTLLDRILRRRTGDLGNARLTEESRRDSRRDSQENSREDSWERDGE
jgi:trehalose-phosphatase